MRSFVTLFLGALGVCAAWSCSSPGLITFGNGGAGSTGNTSSGQSTGTANTSSSGSTGTASTSSGSTGTASTSSSGSTGTASTSSSGSTGTTSTSSSGSTGTTSTSSSGSTGTSTTSSSGSGGCVVTNPNADMDGDGWSPATGDCNDCDASVNPGAVDMPGDPSQVDHDCDGAYDPPAPCDTGLALDDVAAADAAKAIELCRTTVASPPLSQKTWGVINAQYVKANGAAFAAPGLQVGIENGFGPNVHPQGGQNMLALSSGHARTTGQAGACGMQSCTDTGAGTPPPGFPQSIPSCDPTTSIYDDVGLQIDMRVPTNATGYAFALKFYTMEFPYWVCTSYTDAFIALVTPAPVGSVNGNIALDTMGRPIGSMSVFMQVCDPAQSSQYGAGCKGMFTTTCPPAPSPYCPSGTAQLQGTGFDVWNAMMGGAGATPWLTTQAPVKGGSEITLRFALWDGGDQSYDSTTLIDDFQWLTGPVVVSTTLLANPK